MTNTEMIKTKEVANTTDWVYFEVNTPTPVQLQMMSTMLQRSTLKRPLYCKNYTQKMQLQLMRKRCRNRQEELGKILISSFNHPCYQ
ncbi:uncharacterized protein LOC142353229 isoform X2 [Convolutriloba macropyga]